MGTRATVANLVREGSLPGDAARGVLHRVAPWFLRAEARCFGDEGPALPPLFILGLPRGGTTLVAQTICHCLASSFVPELSRHLPMAPAFATWIARRGRPEYRSDFASDYGFSAGLASPSEGTFWNLWLEKDRIYDSSSDLAPLAAKALLGTVGRVERIGGGPFVNKNLRNDNRARMLAELFPRARFLAVVRDPSDVAASLMKGRIEVAGGANRWFSIKPRDYDEIRGQAPEVQVARQVIGLLRDLAADADAIGSERFAAVSYEDFCAAPARFIDELVPFLGGETNGFERRATAPDSFALRSHPSDETDALSAAVTAALAGEPEGHPLRNSSARWLARD